MNSEAIDLENWLIEHDLWCPEAQRKFGGMKFAQAWVAASSNERQLVVAHLWDEGAISYRDLWRFRRARGGSRAERDSIDFRRIVFRESEAA